MKDQFNEQKDFLTSLKHEISLLQQQVDYLIRNKKALGLLDLDVMMNRIHTIYDQLCSTNIGATSDDDEELDIAPEMLNAFFGIKEDQETEENTPNDHQADEETAVVDTTPQTETPLPSETENTSEAEMEKAEEPAKEDYGFIFKMEPMDSAQHTEEQQPAPEIENPIEENPDEEESDEEPIEAEPLQEELIEEETIETTSFEEEPFKENLFEERTIEEESAEEESAEEELVEEEPLEEEPIKENLFKEVTIEEEPIEEEPIEEPTISENTFKETTGVIDFGEEIPEKKNNVYTTGDEIEMVIPHFDFPTFENDENQEETIEGETPETPSPETELPEEETFEEELPEEEEIIHEEEPVDEMFHDEKPVEEVFHEEKPVEEPFVEKEEDEDFAYEPIIFGNMEENEEVGFEIETPETIGEKMQHEEDHSLAAKLQNQSIRNLKSAIGINDKFLLVNELFSGSMEKYNRSIENLDDVKTLNGALIYLNELRIDLQWNSNNEAYKKLLDLIHRKFEA